MIANETAPGVEVWRGGVNTWECDDMGHMNVRFYVVRALEGLAGLAARLGMPRAFAPEASATLLLRETHIRFLREAHARAPLYMRAWVAGMGETEARLVLVLFHSETGEPAATFQMVVAHVTPQDGRAFPWSPETREKAQALTAPVPDYAAARGVSLATLESQAGLERADALGLMTIAAGVVTHRDCDAFGRMSAEQFIGRVSDGIPALVNTNRRIVLEGLDNPPERVGGAVLEYRLAHLDWPRIGDAVVIRSGLAGADHRTQRMIHWLLDPMTGKAWGTSEAVAVTFDLEARKIVPVSPKALAALNGLAIKGLAL